MNDAIKTINMNLNYSYLFIAKKISMMLIIK